MAARREADPLATVVELVRRVTDVAGNADLRLRAISDALTESLDSTTGLMLHGAPVGFAVRAVGRAATAQTRLRLGEQVRITGDPDPLIDRFREGDLSPTTAAAAFGGQTAWQASPQCRGSVEIWGIDQVAALPVRGGVEFVAFLIGRRGPDYDEQDLQLLRVVQPVVAGLTRLLEPEQLDLPDLRVARLTDREREVLQLLAAGHKAATIARRAGCSIRTVHRHLSNIYLKLEVGDRLAAVSRARRLGLIDDEYTLAGPRHG